MSVEVNLRETLTVANKNEKTKELLKEVSKYLIDNWGIDSLTLIADGKVYKFAGYPFDPNSELYTVLLKLDSYSDISYYLISCNGSGIWWRQESSFMKFFTDDEDIKQTVQYKCLEYYDQDDEIVGYVYDSQGGREIECDSSITALDNVSSWYTYNFCVTIEGEEEDFTEEVCESLMDMATAIAEKYDFLNEIDEPYDGEMMFGESFSIENENIPDFISRMEALHKFAIDNNLSIDLVAPFIAEDDDTYAFAYFEFKKGRCVPKYALY